MFRCRLPYTGNLGIKHCYRLGRIISLEEKTVGRTCTKAIYVVTETETDVETMLEKLLQLLWFSTEAMPDPRLRSTTLEAQNIVEGAHAVKEERTTKVFTEADLCFKSR